MLNRKGFLLIFALLYLVSFNIVFASDTNQIILNEGTENNFIALDGETDINGFANNFYDDNDANSFDEEIIDVNSIDSDEEIIDVNSIDSDEEIRSNDLSIFNQYKDNKLSAYGNNPLSVESGSFESLFIAINSVNDEINLFDDYYFSEGDARFINGIPITRNLTIDGNGHTIDARNQSRIFNIQNENLTVIFKNLNLINGKPDKGSLIYGKCTIINCTLYDSTSKFGNALYFTGINSQVSGCQIKKDLTFDFNHVDFSLTFTLGIDYANFIQGNYIKSNLSYWNGLSYKRSYLYDPFIPLVENNITVEIYNALGGLVENITLKTNDDGQAMYNFEYLPRDTYTFKAYYMQGETLLQIIGSLAQIVEGDKFSDIQRAVDEANPDDIIYLKGINYTNDMGSHIIINKSLSIQGVDGTVLDSEGRSRIFYVKNAYGQVIFKDIYFINGLANEGGAIYGKSTAINCTFLNNTADFGGAIHKASAINCTFRDNVAEEGGAIYLSGSNFTIFSCIFENNIATDFGGAICFDSAQYSNMSNCTFKRNKAKTGGSLNIAYSNYISLLNSSFTNSIAELAGGAINYDFAVHSIIDNCIFENNSAQAEGGAFVWIYSSGNITGNGFRNNSALGNGGAIYINIIDRDTLVENQVLTNCNFSFNHGKNGGAIYCNEYYKISGSEFIFINNSADECGGALYFNEFNCSDSIFINNSAGVNGGAVSCGDNCYFFNNSFINNSALGNGGALHCNDYCSLSKVDFFNNSAQNGGAVYSNDRGNFLNLNFYNNTASNNGGAVHCIQRNNFYFSEFLDNSAVSGAAIYADGYNYIQNSTFLGNKAISELDVTKQYLLLTINLLGKNNYLNAIYSTFDLGFSGVTFWNGTIANTNDMDYIPKGCPGQRFSIEIYDSSNVLVENITRLTNEYGQILIDFSYLEVGNYTCNVYHAENDYNTECSSSFVLTVGNFIKLQHILFFAEEGSTINLRQNYTYSLGYDDIYNELSIDYNSMSINGNGYTIDTLNKSSIVLSTAANAKNINIYNLNFRNNISLDFWGVSLRKIKKVNISDCSFENVLIDFSQIENVYINNSTFMNVTGMAVKIDYVNNALFSHCSFVNCSSSDRSVLFFREFDNIDIESSNFSSNQAYDGGVIYAYGNYLTVSNSNFIDNFARGDGGAINGRGTNVKLYNSNFFNNSADMYGGALYLTGLVSDENFTVDNCVFLDNFAYKGAAIYMDLVNNFINNSVFLNNKASYNLLTGDIDEDYKVKITFTGGNNLINAIYTIFDVVCENVSYWNGDFVNSNDITPVKGYCSGQDLTIKFYNSSNDRISMEILRLDDNNQLIFDYLDLSPPTTASIAVYHENNEYFSLSNSILLNTSIIGEFGRLQFLLDNPINGEVNLTKDYTFTIATDNFTSVNIFRDNLIVNGNGHVINGLNNSHVFQIYSSNVTLNNITFINEANSHSSLILWDGATDCKINDCSFINIKCSDDFKAISVYSNHTRISNCNFINVTGVGIMLYSGCENVVVFNCSFINDSNGISSIGAKNGLISYCSFDGNGNNRGGALDLELVENFYIEDCNFTGNNASLYGGAIYLHGKVINISNCIFKDNHAGAEGGAIGGITTDLCIYDCKFFNNSAVDGGAIYSNEFGNLSIDYSVFMDNWANEGGAIYCLNFENIFLRNSEFLSNMAGSESLDMVGQIGEEIVIAFKGGNNYINAIRSPIEFEMENVSYWNGEIINSDDFAPMFYCYSGINIVLEIYDLEGNLVDNLTLITDDMSRVSHNITYLDDGDYLFNAYHLDDDYYTFIGGCEGNFALNRFSSSVNINIDNQSEFVYSDCNISFDIENKTISRVIITNVDGSIVYVNQTVNENFILVDLNPMEDFYNITVINYPDVQYNGSQDSKLFKIVKANSSISFDPISDIIFTDEIFIEFQGDNLTVINLTVVNLDNGETVFHNISSELFAVIQPLSIGRYNITAINMGDDCHLESVFSRIFNVVKAGSFVNITSISDVIYNQKLKVEFTVENRTSVNVTVINIGTNVTVFNKNVDGNFVIIPVLPVGVYNITVNNMGDDNYLGSSDSRIFNVLKANSSIRIDSISDNVYGNDIVVSFVADNVTSVNATVVDTDGGSVVFITVDDNIFTISGLSAGTYNLTLSSFENEFYYGSSDSRLFSVGKAGTFVNITSVSDGVYGNPVTVDFYVENMTEVNVAVVDIASGSVVFEVNTTDLSVTVSDLPVGSFNITVVNVGNENYVGSSDSRLFSVGKANSEININPIPDIYYGSIVNIEFDGYNLTSVNLTVVDIDSDKIVFTEVTTLRVVSIQDLPAGRYNVTAINSGDENHTESSSSWTFNILKVDNIVEVISADVYYGRNASIIINATIDGEYIIDLNGETYPVNVSGGQGIISLCLTVGHYYANAIFNNPNYNSIITNAVFDVLPNIDYDMSVEANRPLYGEELIVTIKLPQNITSFVTASIDANIYSSNVSNGIAQFRIPNLGPGDHLLSVSYSGDDYYHAKSVDLMVHVKNVTIRIYDTVYGWAKSIKYQAKLIDEDGNGIAAKEITFSINGTTIKAYTNSNGLATISLSLNIGTYNIKVSSYYGVSTRKISVVSRFRGNKNISMYYFDGSKYSFKVYGDNGKPVGANQVVVVKLNKKTYKIKTNKNGVASLAIPKTVKPGKYTITASYKGQTIKNRINVKTILSSKKIVNVKRTAKKLVLTAKLKKKLKGKKLTFRFMSKNYYAKTNKNGVAKIIIKKNVIKKLNRGKKYTVKISYFKTSIKTKVKVN